MDVVEFADQAANRRKVVLVAALDGTFDRKNFNRILELIPLAEHVTKLNAVCLSKSLFSLDGLKSKEVIRYNLYHFPYLDNFIFQPSKMELNRQEF